jgi:hypothetical protein
MGWGFGFLINASWMDMEADRLHGILAMRFYFKDVYTLNSLVYYNEITNFLHFYYSSAFKNFFYPTSTYSWLLAKPYVLRPHRLQDSCPIVPFPVESQVFRKD